MAIKKKTEQEQQVQNESKGRVPQQAARGSGRFLTSPFEEMDRLFEGFFPRGWMRPFRMEWPAWPEMMQVARVPKVDIVERDNEVLVRAEIPGVKKEDLDVSVTDDTVTIRGTARTEAEDEKGEYYRRELHYGEFARTVALPAAVNADLCSARFKDGILELTLPKVERTKRRTIRIEED
ncbi:MAG: Hsp20/alpha crystallin family protein [Gammaproteobacteria bacterium]